MVESLARIQASLRGLSRREQRLLILQAGLGALCAWLLGWAALAAAVNAGVATPAEGVAWIVGLVLPGFLLGIWPLRRWREALDARRQAERVEALRPELGGALLTVLDRTARPQGSPGILARLAARAAGVVEVVTPATVHPPGAVRRIGALTLLACLVFTLASLVLPLGPIQALAALRTPEVKAEVAAAPVPDGPRAVVGDITLRYLYPTYTGLEPLEVPNSNGEVHAPPGTRVEVRARTAESFAAAALVVYQRPPEAAELVDGRSVRTAFSVEGPGSWRFQFGDLPSPDYAIVPEPDLPPDVAVQSSRRVRTMAVDESLRLQWTARDDFGVQRVVVEVDEGGKKREVPVRAPVDVPRELGGELALTPKELGLQPGATAKLRVAAWDNDAVSGSKAGFSSVIEVEVLGPRGRQDRMDRYRKRIRDELVQVLADFLLDPAPPVATPADAVTWGSAAGARYEKFDALIQEAWGGAESDTFDATMVKALREKRRALVSFASSLSGDRLAERDIATFVTLQADHVKTVENAVLMLDQVLRAAALATINDMVRDLAKEAEDLQQDLSTLSKEGALARLDQLRRAYQQLQREAAKLDEGSLREFLNDRSDRIQALMDEVRKALAEGRTQDAQELMERLAQQMREMAQQVDDMQQQRNEASDKLQKAMEKLQEDLAALEKDQAGMRERTEAAREKYGQDLEQAVSAWEEIEKLAGVVEGDLKQIDNTLDPFKAPSWGGGSLLDDAKADAAGLHDSARARDLETALQRADQLSGEIGMLQNRASSAIRRGKGEGLAPAQRTLEAQQKNVERIRELLEKMARRQAQTSPALQQELQKMAEAQEEIAKRAQRTQEMAGKISENLPMDAPGLKEGAQQGAEQAGRAGQAMRDGDPMSAEGGQRSAEDGFRQAQDALGEARRNMEQMQRAASGRGGQKSEKDGEGGEGDKNGDGSDMLGEDVTLPAPEAFHTPEEYRKALLEGMEGEVPEEYKALNRRYYEELVRQ